MYFKVAVKCATKTSRWDNVRVSVDLANAPVTHVRSKINTHKLSNSYPSCRN